MHKKLNEMPKEWPLPRKGKKYMAVASHQCTKGFPLLFALRDILKIAKTYREARKLCLAGKIKVNGKIRKDVMFPLLVRDVLSLDEMKKMYTLKVIGRKLNLEETKEGKTKIVKVLDKKVLGKNLVQANLEDGTNIIIKEKFSCGDSLLVDLEKNRIINIIPLKKGSNIEVIAGKHLGDNGVVLNLIKEGDKTVYEIKLNGEKKVFLEKKTILAIE